MTPFDTLLWWDEKGPFKILHQISPLRIRWVLESFHSVTSHNEADPIDSFEGHLKEKRILDLGCGGGLLAEPLARLGARVVGIDPSEQAIASACQHADLCRGMRKESLYLQYHVSDVESWTQADHSVDAVIVMEVLEHLNNPFDLLKRCSSWIKQGGTLIGSTLNRTLWSYLLGIGMAEYVLGWVPKGTHQWKDFLTPQEIEKMLLALGFTEIAFRGFSWKPFQGQWQLSDSLDVNYFFSALKS